MHAALRSYAIPRDVVVQEVAGRAMRATKVHPVRVTEPGPPLDRRTEPAPPPIPSAPPSRPAAPPVTIPASSGPSSARRATSPAPKSRAAPSSPARRSVPPPLPPSAKGRRAPASTGGSKRPAPPATAKSVPPAVARRRSSRPAGTAAKPAPGTHRGPARPAAESPGLSDERVRQNLLPVRRDATRAEGVDRRHHGGEHGEEPSRLEREAATQARRKVGRLRGSGEGRPHGPEAGRQIAIAFASVHVRGFAGSRRQGARRRSEGGDEERRAGCGGTGSAGSSPSQKRIAQ